MAYEYHVFISYRIKSRSWLEEVFLTPFLHFLEEEIAGIEDEKRGTLRNKVFIDWHEIDSGAHWESRILKGLAHSPCLLAFLLPSYFQSTWCKKEFAVFEYRSRQIGMLGLQNPNSLIIPIALHNINRFPDSLTNSFQVNFKWEEYYCANVKGYDKRDDFHKFQNEVKKLAEVVAQRIIERPKWDQKWAEPQWLDCSTEHLQIKPPIIKPSWMQ